MLRFFSGSSNNINSGKAMYECLGKALQNEPDMDCNLIVLFTAMGHNFRELLDEANRISPGARIIGCTGEGVIGSEGPDESLKAVFVMAVKGPESEFAIAGIDNAGSYEPFDVGAMLAKDLKSRNDRINTILFYPSLKGKNQSRKRIVSHGQAFMPRDSLLHWETGTMYTYIHLLFVCWYDR